MMRLIGMLSVLIVAIALAGCSAVYSTKPMGGAPVSINPEAWQGTWIHKDDVITIEIVDAEKGLLRAAWIEDMKLESFNVHLLAFGDWIFGSAKDEQKESLFVWGRIKHEDRQLIVWCPSVSKFKAMVQDGVLPGTVDDDGNVTLGELTADHMSIIASDVKDVLFDWDDPYVFVRLSK